MTAGQQPALAGRYQLGAVLRTDGPIRSFDGRDLILDRAVTVVVAGPEVAADPARADRFRWRGLAVARLSHQNVAAVFDVGPEAVAPGPDGPAAGADGCAATGPDGTESGGPDSSAAAGIRALPGPAPVDCIVTESVDGLPVRRLLDRDGPLPPYQVAAILRPVCAALAAAHAESVYGWDVTPDRLVVSPAGHVKLAAVAEPQLEPGQTEGSGPAEWSAQSDLVRTRPRPPWGRTWTGRWPRHRSRPAPSTAGRCRRNWAPGPGRSRASSSQHPGAAGRCWRRWSRSR